MPERRRGLGRGLGALIPPDGDPSQQGPARPTDVFFADRPAARATPETPGAGTARPRRRATAEERTRPTELRAVPDPAVDAADGGDPVVLGRVAVDQVVPNPRQPRREFAADAMAELVHSVREIGVLQPIVVRPAPHPREGARYEVVMGERRWRASVAAGLATVPAVVRATPDDDLLRDALLENLHRSGLNPLEEAAAYQQLLEDFGCTHDQLADRLGRSRPQVSNTLRLLRLPVAVQRRVVSGALSAGHARALLGLSEAAMEAMAARVLVENLSVRATEAAVAASTAAAPATPPRPASQVPLPGLDGMVDALSDRLAAPVRVAMGARRGRLVVEFSGVDDLRRILAVLGPDGGPGADGGAEAGGGLDPDGDSGTGGGAGVSARTGAQPGLDRRGSDRAPSRGRSAPAARPAPTTGAGQTPTRTGGRGGR